MPFVVAVDQGTTGTTVLVFDRQGRVAGRAYSEFTQHYPKPGWVEHDAEEMWRVTLRVLRLACRRARVRARDVTALGITNQRETTLLWDRQSGRPVHRAIVWQDRRTASLCEELRARGLEDVFRQKTGLVLDPYFSGTKLRWLLEHVPRAAERARAGELAAGTIDTWLMWKLTGGAVHATDPTNASRTLLFDIHAGAWDAALCDLLHVPAALLPAVKPSSGEFGATEASVLGAPVATAGVARAALESLAFQTRDVADAMAADADSRLSTLRVDGGAAANDFLMQFQADVLGVPVDRPRVVETTAMGAAFLAGLGVGFWKAQAELARARRVDRRFEPKMKAEVRDALYRGWQEAVARVRSAPRG